MYLSELVGGLRRRWWAVVIGLLGTAAITYVAFTLVPPEQQAHASLVILPPAKTVGERGNPYLALGGLQPAADMLAAAMNSGPVHASLAPSHGSATFEVAQDANSSGPMLLVSVSDDDPKRTLALLDSVIETMPHVLAQLQEQVNVRTSNRLTLTEVTRDTQAEPSVKKLAPSDARRGGRRYRPHRLRHQHARRTSHAEVGQEDDTTGALRRRDLPR